MTASAVFYTKPIYSSGEEQGVYAILCIQNAKCQISFVRGGRVLVVTACVHLKQTY